MIFHFVATSVLHVSTSAVNIFVHRCTPQTCSLASCYDFRPQVLSLLNTVKYNHRKSYFHTKMYEKTCIIQK